MPSHQCPSEEPRLELLAMLGKDGSDVAMQLLKPHVEEEGLVEEGAKPRETGQVIHVARCECYKLFAASARAARAAVAYVKDKKLVLPSIESRLGTGVRGKRKWPRQRGSTHRKKRQNSRSHPFLMVCVGSGEVKWLWCVKSVVKSRV